MEDPRFPPIEPYDSGMLAVGDRQLVYWECCGNPNGKPYATSLFPVTDLSQPAVILESGEFPACVGFDVQTGGFYGHNRDACLIVFDAQGRKKREVKMDPRSNRTQFVLPHPDGGKVLVLSQNGLCLVNLPD